MKARDIMTGEIATATRETSLEAIAKMFVERDCGAIPIVESASSRKPVGIVTDRDIVCRVVAAGKDALKLTAADCMSSPCVTGTPDTRLDECCTAMEKAQVRRLVIVDSDGACCGMVSQADIARRVAGKAGEVVQEVSRSSRVPA